MAQALGQCRGSSQPTKAKPHMHQYSVASCVTLEHERGMPRTARPINGCCIPCTCMGTRVSQWLLSHGTIKLQLGCYKIKASLHIAEFYALRCCPARWSNKEPGLCKRPHNTQLHVTMHVTHWCSTCWTNYAMKCSLLYAGRKEPW